jgi:membrane protease YdiL (CAAX protease family)
VLVGLLKLAAGFAAVGALALWFWATQGPERVDRMIVNVDRQASEAFSSSGLVRLLFVAIIGPIVEEIVFRGFIYRAFERKWGWIGSLLATSALFGLYHAHFGSAFTGSVILTCLLRRTGSLWAPIAVHMFFNFMLWWPLLGQHLFPHGVVLSDPASWAIQGACLAFTVIAVPTYVWMSRDRAAAPTVLIEPDGALQK